MRTTVFLLIAAVIGCFAGCRQDPPRAPSSRPRSRYDDVDHETAAKAHEAMQDSYKEIDDDFYSQRPY